MIAISRRSEMECEDCFEKKTVYEIAINGNMKKQLCTRCRDKKIDKWFDAQAKIKEPEKPQPATR